MTRCPHREDVASFVLGALPEDEHAAFAAHLPACAACSAEVAELQGVADTLPLAAVQIAPPPELKDRLMAIVRAEAELPAASGPEAEHVRRSAEPPPRRRWWRRPVLALRPVPAALVATVLLAAGVAGGFALFGDDGRTEVRGRILAAAPGASAVLAVGDDDAELRVRGLPRPPAGKVYQVWLEPREGEGFKATTALFTVDERGDAEVRVPERLKGVDRVLVTAEPDGGSMQPTSDPILTARPA